MEIGAAIFFTDYSITPTDLAVALARIYPPAGRSGADQGVLRRDGPVRHA